MVITIRNWETFNPRKDIKRSSWFRLEHDIMVSPDFYSFSGDEFKALIYLLCEQSRAQGKPFRVNFDHAARSSNVRRQALESTLVHLQEIQFVILHETDTIRGRYADVTSTNADVTFTYATNERTNERTRRLSRSRTSGFAGDFNSVYQKYPRKEGKAKGLAKCKAQIKSQEDFDLLSQAVSNYAKKKAGVEARFLMYFSTFMETGAWRDWLDPETGSAGSGPEAWPPNPEAEEINRRAEEKERKRNAAESK